MTTFSIKEANLRIIRRKWQEPLRLHSRGKRVTVSSLKSHNLSKIVTLITALFANPVANAQANLPIYTNDLVNGFQNWSWAPCNFANTSPVYTGTYSISVNATNWQALYFEHSDFNTSLYTNVSFWLDGGAKGGQSVQIVGLLDGTGQEAYVLPALTANTWKQFTIPLSSLGVANQSNCDGFYFQLTASGTTNTFYVDDIQLGATPAPAVTHLTVNAAQTLRTADVRWAGVNTAIWDSDFDTSETISQLNEAGLTMLRFPGGSASDEYNWVSNMSIGQSYQWATSFSSFAKVATNIGATVVITANYGTGTPALAAAWVKNSNVTNHYGFKYWEIGNEVYGTWETDSNTYPNDPYTYATRAQSYIQQMKAADPTIKVGIVVTTGEDTDSNGYNNHPATNTVTHQVHYGWTPVLLSTLKQLGVTPDFAIYHWYPQDVAESDPMLLQGTSNWVANAADLRGQIADYFGTAGTNIELLVTENNCDAGTPGKQLTSVVNAIYYADSLGQLMQTEFNSFIWWDLRNGTDYGGDLDPTLYGWRLYGDEGIMNGQGTALTNRYPTFFAIKLMQHFVRAGDTVLGSASDYALLPAYGVRRTNGTLTMLVINKDPGASFSAQISLNGFLPSPGATLYSYGIPQDNAAATGIGSCDIAQSNFTVPGTNFSYTFSPYTASVFVFSPTAPALAAVQGAFGAVVLQLTGQAGTPYILQTSTNLTKWTSISTNLLAGASLNVTNTPTPGAPTQYWRAVWQP
jgi:alpha-N-arabinofuranosidase